MFLTPAEAFRNVYFEENSGNLFLNLSFSFFSLNLSIRRNAELQIVLGVRKLYNYISYSDSIFITP